MSAATTLSAKHPVVLLHGAAGFVDVGLGIRYFRGVRRLLEREGNRVYAWKLPNLFASVERRARLLLGHLRAHESEGPFNLIAHSMGGLDARLLISSLGGADLVASLTTIGTPHHGTCVADWRTRLLAGLSIMRFLRRRRSHLALEMEVFTADWARRFNDRHAEVGGVRCRAWAGEAPTWSMCPLLQALAPLIARSEGPSDGLISVASARWSDEHFAGTVPADHFAQLGWKLGLNRLDGFDHQAFYRDILRDLVEAGL